MLKHQSNRSDVVARFVHYQQSGEGFDGIWSGIEPIVSEFASRSLAKLGVKAVYGADEWAVADVVNQTAVRLLGLARPNATGRFDPARAKPGISGLRGWLWGVVARLSVDWARVHRDARVVPVSTLTWNELPSGDEVDSFLDRLAAKIERPDLLPILNECISRLEDPFLRQVMQLRLHDGLSERAAADRLGMSAPTIHRRLHDAYDLLRPMLEQFGVDEAWLAA
jgi:hypothetical protein